MTVPPNGFLVVSTIHRRSGIERDAVQNTFHYTAPQAFPTDVQYNDWMDLYRQFLHEIHTMYSACLGATPGYRVEFFKLTPEKPAPGTGLGAPLHTLDGTWATLPATIGYPSEVAICLTLDGTSTVDAEEGPGNTRPASRKRNRKYIGPLAATVGEAMPSTNELHVIPGIATQLTTAWRNLMMNAMIEKGWGCSVFSKVLWALNAINSVWCDDAFDTQRRRGQDPTAKTVNPAEGFSELWVSNQRKAVGQELSIGPGGIVRAA
jgi:hypothetical protein